MNRLERWLDYWRQRLFHRGLWMTFSEGITSRLLCDDFTCEEVARYAVEHQDGTLNFLCPPHWRSFMRDGVANTYLRWGPKKNPYGLPPIEGYHDAPRPLIPMPQRPTGLEHYFEHEDEENKE